MKWSNMSICASLARIMIEPNWGGVRYKKEEDIQRDLDEMQSIWLEPWL